MEDREFASVKAKNIHGSRVIPPRLHGLQIGESVKALGVQQPLIVRPLASRPDQYELIDGAGRLDALDPEQEVTVEVRANASDAEVFRISEATSKRTQRSASENAKFYSDYLEAVKKETGEKGALARLASETQVSESELSQYLSINKLFAKLSSLDIDSEFSGLKTMGINKLYELSKLVDHPRLLETAEQIDKTADKIAVEAIVSIVGGLLGEEEPAEAISRQLSGEETTGSTTVSPSIPMNESITSAGARYEEVSTRLQSLVGEIKTVISRIENQHTLGAASESPDTIGILQKMHVSLRRLSYYLQKLETMPDGKAGT